MGFVQIGFLAALAAVTVPIIIHLVFGQRARRVDLGTLRFLKIVLRENVRRRRIKRWLLLALRMACLALLALLFARPYLVAHELPGDERLVVILLDRSASMGLETDRGRLLDLAVAQAKQIIAGCRKGTELRVAWFDHAVHPLVGSAGQSSRPAGSLAALEDALADPGFSKPPCSSTDYGAAIAWARDACAQSDCGWKEVHLLTDLQRSGLDRTPAEPLPADVRVTLVDVGQTYPENAAVARVTCEKLMVRPGEAVTISATAFNAGQFALNKVPVVLYLSREGRQQVIRSPVDLDAGASGTVQFELANLAQGLWQGYVELETEDALAFDNRRHVALRVAPPFRVLLVDGDPGSSPLRAETYFLERALRLAPPDETYADSPFEPVTVSRSGSDALPDLKGADLVVLANVASLSAPDARRAAGFVESGGGLLVFTGENVDSQGDRTLAAANLGIGEITGTKRAAALPWRLESWDREHSLFLPFNDPQYADLRRLAFRAYTGVKPAKSVRVLARFRGGEPAIIEREHGQGKMLWFLSACDRDWSDWPRSRLYLPLVHQMLGCLAGLTEGGPVRNVLIDEVEPGRDEPVPGVFDRGRYHEVINVNPRESEMDRCTVAELSARFGFRVRSDQGADPGGDEPSRAVAATLRPDEIWHWVILVLLAVLFVESFLANRTTA